MKKVKIAIIYGGFSNEKKISLATANTIKDNLDNKLYSIYLLDLAIELKKIINLILNKKIDLVIPAVHGWGGEDGRLQGMLDLLGIKYIFSSHTTHAIAMNKKMTKIIAQYVKLNTIPDVLLKKEDKINYNSIIKKLNFPIITKPNSCGSSIGVKIAKNLQELKAAISYGFKFDDELLLEKYIAGREFSVVVCNDKAIKILPPIEIIPKISSFFDYKAKYLKNASQEICPVKINKTFLKQLKNNSINIYKTLNCKDVSRIDYILDLKTKQLYFLEINTIPGMTNTSLLPKVLRADNSSLKQLLQTSINKKLRNK